jgi:hypothetical protein
VVYAPTVKIQNFDKNRPVCIESDESARTALLVDAQYDRYKWIRPNGDSVVGINQRALIPLSDGLHRIIVTNFYTNNSRTIACSASDQIDLVRVKNFFNFRGFGDSTLLCNTGNNSILLNMDTARNSPYFGVQIDWFKNRVDLNLRNNWQYNITDGGYYKAVIRDKDRCIIKDSLFVNYVDQISVNLGGDTLVACIEDLPIQSALELRANPTGNYDYVWTAPTGVTIPQNTLLVRPTTQGTYSLEAIDKRFPACRGKATTYVIRPTNDFKLDWDSLTFVNCDTTKLELCGARDMAQYIWYRNNELIPGQNTRCFNSFQDSAVYKLEMIKFYTKSLKCQGDASATVKSYEKIEVGLNNGVSAFCYPHATNALVVATPNLGTYEWIPNVTNTHSFIPARDGRYSLTVTNKDRCKGRGFTDVVLVPEITFDSLFSKERVSCWYEPITLKAGPDFAKYEWSGMTPILADNVSEFTPKLSGTYQVIVTTKLGNCKDTASIKLTFIDNFTVEVSNDILRCDNQSVTFLVNNSSGLYDSFSWFKDNVLLVEETGKLRYTPPIPVIPDGSVTSSMNIIAKVGIKGCFAQDNFALTYFRENKPFEFSIDTCIGTIVKFSPGSGFASYFWRFNGEPLLSDLEGAIDDKRVTITVKEPGSYVVDLNSSCGAYQPIYDLENFPEIQLDLGEDRTFCVGEPYYIINKKDSAANKAYLYSWTDLESNNILNRNVTSSRYDISNMVLMSLGVVDTFGCVKKDTVMIGVNDDCFTIPNLITPGSKDDLNNTFAIRGMFKGEWAIEIYNRWGDRVYKNEKYNNEWGGDNVVDGIYYYSLKNPGRDKEYKGWLQVINN